MNCHVSEETDWFWDASFGLNEDCFNAHCLITLVIVCVCVGFSGWWCPRSIPFWREGFTPSQIYQSGRVGVIIMFFLIQDELLPMKKTCDSLFQNHMYIYIYIMFHHVSSGMPACWISEAWNNRCFRPGRSQLATPRPCGTMKIDPAWDSRCKKGVSSSNYSLEYAICV